MATCTANNTSTPVCLRGKRASDPSSSLMHRSPQASTVGGMTVPGKNRHAVRVRGTRGHQNREKRLHTSSTSHNIHEFGPKFFVFNTWKSPQRLVVCLFFVELNCKAIFEKKRPFPRIRAAQLHPRDRLQEAGGSSCGATTSPPRPKDDFRGPRSKGATYLCASKKQQPRPRNILVADFFQNANPPKELALPPGVDPKR